jgi:signal recognition particle subunit SRP54
MVPGMGQMAKQLDAQEVSSDLKRIEAIINSMTAQERRTPTLLNASRRRRVARGSGTTVEDVNQLTKRFRDMQKMMKQAGMLGEQSNKRKKRRRRRHREQEAEGLFASLRQGRIS